MLYPVKQRLQRSIDRFGVIAKEHEVDEDAEEQDATAQKIHNNFIEAQRQLQEVINNTPTAPGSAPIEATPFFDGRRRQPKKRRHRDG